VKDTRDQEIKEIQEENHSCSKIAITNRYLARDSIGKRKDRMECNAREETPVEKQQLKHNTEDRKVGEKDTRDERKTRHIER